MRLAARVFQTIADANLKQQRRSVVELTVEYFVWLKRRAMLLADVPVCAGWPEAILDKNR